jgi:hypothetical protein
VIDLRIWRLALLGVPLALIVAMFSLTEVPEPLSSSLPPDAFDSEAALNLAKQLSDSSPEPTTGSDADATVADLVESRFTAIPSATVSEQVFEAEVAGEKRELRNLIVAIPGQSDRQVALIAHRDVARGEGAGSSLAATAAMLEIANGFAGSPHRKSLVFVSTDGGEAGAIGARRFIRDYSDAGQLDGVVVLSQPASPAPSPPLVIPWSTGAESTAAQLDQTASEIVSDQADRPAGDEGPLGDLFRLALPSALGEQGPLIEAGVDSVRISSSGELAPEPGSSDAADLNGESLDRFGRSALALMLALDASADPPEQGPRTYLGLAGNLLPGWTLSLLALALLAAPLATAGAGIARSAHSPIEALAGIGWTLLRGAPFAIALALVYAFAFFGLIPSPEWPFEPAAESLGTGGTIGVVIALLALLVSGFLLRPLLPPAPTIAGIAPASALLVATLAGLGVWWVNPYLGFLVAIGLQAWVAAGAGVGRTRLGAAGLVAAGLIPVIALVLDLAGRFEAGPGVVWDLLLMFTGGQIGDRLAILACVLAGAGLALIASTGPPAVPGTRQLGLRALVARGRALAEPETSEPPPEAEPADEGALPEESEGAGQPEPEGPGPEPEPEGPVPEPEPEPEPEPGSDPRIWSKPRSSIRLPLPSVTAPASPSVTSPIAVS